MISEVGVLADKGSGEHAGGGALPVFTKGQCQMTNDLDSVLRDYLDTVVVDVPLEPPVRSRTRTRHTIPIPRETMSELVFPVGTPAGGVHVDRARTADMDRTELARLVEATRPNQPSDHAIAARMAMTADVGAPLELGDAIVRELGLARRRVIGALVDAGMARLAFARARRDLELYGAQAGSPVALVAVSAGDRVRFLHVRAGGRFVAYTVRSVEDARKLALYVMAESRRG